MGEYNGIDYGHGTTNVDRASGIRFGVISMHSLAHWAYDDVEDDYGPPTCGKCGNEAVDYDDETHGEYRRGRGCCDYACESCEHYLDSSDVFSEESLGWSYEADGYSLVNCLDNDAMVLASPFYTFAQFCSPCVPGAGDLDNAMEEGAKTYCLGHDWFEEWKAPYRVFSVETGLEVLPESSD